MGMSQLITVGSKGTTQTYSSSFQSWSMLVSNPPQMSWSGPRLTRLSDSQGAYIRISLPSASNLGAVWSNTAISGRSLSVLIQQTRPLVTLERHSLRARRLRLSGSMHLLELGCVSLGDVLQCRSEPSLPPWRPQASSPTLERGVISPGRLQGFARI